MIALSPPLLPQMRLLSRHRHGVTLLASGDGSTKPFPEQYSGTLPTDDIYIS